MVGEAADGAEAVRCGETIKRREEHCRISDRSTEDYISIGTAFVARQASDAASQGRCLMPRILA